MDKPHEEQTEKAQAPASMDSIAESMLSDVSTEPQRSAAADAQEHDDADDLDIAVADDEDHQADEPADDKAKSEAENKSDEDDPLGDLFDDASITDRDVDGEGDTSKAGELGDDTKLSVTVDGEEVEVTIGELKRRYAGEGAIEKRLQAATEARNTAVADYQHMQQLATSVFQRFGQFLFRSTVPQPDPSLLESNPNAYIRQKEAYEQEQNALKNAHAELYALMGQTDKQFEEMRQAKRVEAAKRLREIMPVFNDPVKGPKVKEAIIEAAKEIGYTDADIAACDDPLMFKTMALAARELRRMKTMQAKPSVEKIRTLKPAASNRAAKPAAAREEAVAMKRAKTTGALDDIAASMLIRQKKSR